MRSLCFARAFLAALLLAPPALAEKNVWIVDDDAGPGVDFTDLTSAFWSIASGDVLLVRPGYYSGMFAIADDLEFSLVADGPDVLVNTSYISLINLAANKRIVVRGITFTNSSIELSNNSGIVWFEGCTILADQYGGSGNVAALVAGNSKLVLKDAYIHGSMPYGFHHSPPTAGLYIWGTTASLTNVMIFGGDGQDTIYPDFRGANAISAYDSTLVISNATLYGGAGFSQPGGAGLALEVGSTAWLRSVSSYGGSGNPTGQPTRADPSSSLKSMAHPLRTLTASSPVRSGQLLSVTIHGEPGEAVMLQTGPRPIMDLDPAGLFLLVKSVSSMSTFLGMVPPGGTLTYTTPVPDLGPQPALEIFLQARYLDLVQGRTRARIPVTASVRSETGSASSVLLLND